MLSGQLSPEHEPLDEAGPLVLEDSPDILPVLSGEGPAFIVGAEIQRGTEAHLVTRGGLNGEVGDGSPVHGSGGTLEEVVHVGGGQVGVLLQKCRGPPLPLHLVVHPLVAVGVGARQEVSDLSIVEEVEAAAHGPVEGAVQGSALQIGSELQLGAPESFPHGDAPRFVHRQTAAIPDVAEKTGGGSRKVPGAVVHSQPIGAPSAVTDEPVVELAVGVEAGGHAELHGEPVGKVPGPDLNGAAGEVSRPVRGVGLLGGEALHESRRKEIQGDHFLLGFRGG